MRVVTTLVSNRLPALSASMAAEVDRIVRRAALRIEANVKESMALPHSGQLYGGHRASAPGEAPAIDTGALVNSIQTDMDGPAQAVVSTNVDYAVYQEYGTRLMAPRPFFAPATEAERTRFLHEMDELERGMR
jgi:HK97 gp10 family phage protein